jgi:hypothetical protein
MMIGKYLAAALIPAALGLVLLLQASGAMADNVTVKNNGTPLTLAPTRNAPTEWKVNSGFPLTVVEERGGWLRIQSDRLPDEGHQLWVRANQVVGQGGPSSTGTALEKPIGYRVELTGTPDLKFKMDCRIAKADGHVGFRPHYNRLPRTYEFSSDPLACFVWKKQHSGDLEVSLVEVYASKERIIGHVATQDYDFSTSILARSRGPDYPTTIFARSKTPWGPEAVALTTYGSLFLSSYAFTGP